MNKQKSEEYLFNILTQDYSGGAKLTELVTKVVQDFHLAEDFAKQHGFDGLLLVNVPDYIEEVCKESKRIGVLEYVWHRVNRVKTFIYTK